MSQISFIMSLQDQFTPTFNKFANKQSQTVNNFSLIDRSAVKTFSIVETAAIKAGNVMVSAFNKAKSFILSIFKSLGSAVGIGGLLSFGGIAAGLANAVKSGIKAGMEDQKLKTAMVAMYGEVEGTAKSKMLEKFAATTPFETTNVNQAGFFLAQIGALREDMLYTVGDIAATTGKTIDEVAQAVKNATTGQFMMLRNLGYDKKTLGLSDAQMRDKDLLLKTIQTKANIKAKDATLALAKTLEGATSSLKSNIRTLLAQLTGWDKQAERTGSLYDSLGKMVSAVNDAVSTFLKSKGFEKLKDWFDKNTTPLIKRVEDFFLALTDEKNMERFLNNIHNLWINTIDTFKIFWLKAKELYNAVANVANTIWKSLGEDKIKNLGDAIIDTTDSLIRLVQWIEKKLENKGETANEASSIASVTQGLDVVSKVSESATVKAAAETAKSVNFRGIANALRGQFKPGGSSTLIQTTVAMKKATEAEKAAAEATKIAEKYAKVAKFTKPIGKVLGKITDKLWILSLGLNTWEYSEKTGSGYKGAAHGLAKTGFSAGGAKAGAVGGAYIGSFGGPFSPFTVPAGAIIGAGIVGWSGGFVYDQMYDIINEKPAMTVEERRSEKYGTPPTPDTSKGITFNFYGDIKADNVDSFITQLSQQTGIAIA